MVRLPLLRMVMLIWSSVLCQIRSLLNTIWDMLDQIMHSPLAGPTVSGRAVLIQAGLLALLLLIAYAAAG